MPADPRRLLRALAREGLTVTRDRGVTTVRLTAAPDAPAAEILLPDALPLEAKAARQLANLAAAHHPEGGRVCRVCATPDFHPGDAGVPIGAVVETDGLVVPGAVGNDVNCGMRLHATGLTLDRFLAGKDALVAALRGDYLLGTRDVALPRTAVSAMFAGGLPPFVDAARARPLGRLAGVAWDQVARETADTPFAGSGGAALARVWGHGGLAGHPGDAPQTLLPADPDAVVRDDALATVGRGNHFVELQVVDRILDRRLAFAWGLRAGEVVFLVHTGSRGVGRAIGKAWQERARAAWPKGVRHPASGIFPVRGEQLHAYLRAEATAANYGFVNRALLAELCRLRLREVFGDLEAPLVADAPHNLTFREGDRWVSRKGACPAAAGQPVLIPGSMGAASYVGVGLGADRWLRSASHGAGRAQPRGAMGRSLRDAAHARALGLEGVTCVTLREERLLEEAPAAYKPIDVVVDAQVAAGTLGLVARARPLVTFKA